VSVEGIYYLTLQAVDQSGNHSDSVTLIVVVESSYFGWPTQVEPVAVLPLWTVFPIPNNGSMTIQANSAISYDLNVYNIAGQLMYRQTKIKTDQQQLNLDVASGTYMIEILAPGLVKRRKVFIE
jgi:hypothetical protein